MTLEQKKQGHRTLLFDGDRHVATIVEEAKPDYKTKKGYYRWILPTNVGHADTFEEAYDKVTKELGP
jgi:hypothetical protein